MQVARLGSVRNRLVLLFVAITAAAVGFVYLYVVPQLESSLTSQKLTQLESRGAPRVPRLREAMKEGLPPDQLSSLLRRLSQLTGSRVTLLGVPQGSDRPAFVVSDSALERGPVSDDFGLALAAGGGTPVAGVDSSPDGRLAEVATPIPRVNPTWVVVFSEPLDEVESNVALIKRQILIAGGIALLLALVAGYLAARALSRRLGRLEDAARKVAEGDFETPIPVDSSDELGQLAVT